MTGRLLTAEQLAERWQVPVGQVYALARRNEIPTVKLGRYRRFSPEAIARFERAGEGGVGWDVERQRPGGAGNAPGPGHGGIAP